MKQETTGFLGWRCLQLDLVRTICTSLLTKPYQHLITQFFTGRMLFLMPNQPCQITEGKVFWYFASYCIEIAAWPLPRPLDVCTMPMYMLLQPPTTVDACTWNVILCWRRRTGCAPKFRRSRQKPSKSRRTISSEQAQNVCIGRWVSE